MADENERGRPDGEGRSGEVAVGRMARHRDNRRGDTFPLSQEEDDGGNG
jgi:hypothetical protein